MALSSKTWLSRRWLLWASLLALVAGLLLTLIWLAGRYEADQQQVRIDRAASEASQEIRNGLTRNLQSLQALRTRADQWPQDAAELLRSRRELHSLQWRDAQFNLRAQNFSPYVGSTQAGTSSFSSMRDIPFGDLRLTCERARRQSSAAYVPSHFTPAPQGLGQERMEMCLPLNELGEHRGFVVAVYDLQAVLTEWVGPANAKGHELSFTEPDGTRLAIVGKVRRGGRMFSASQLVDLPGNTMLLRVDSWRVTPDLFPNVLTAIVTLMAIALIAVLSLLGRDIGRRLRAERELADALAFRKAMEDSLVTGLRARDMQGRVSYVNPALCAMTGFTAQELIGQSAPMPFWPPELVDEYSQRQAIRLSGNLPAREGYESVFLRKDGSRFPVLIFEAPLIDAQGLQTGWMSAIADMSEQRRVEEISRTSQERLQATARLATAGEMASLLSHELNQPLAAISSYATGTVNMLSDTQSLPKQDVAHALERIREQAERAGRVIKSVHDFVRRRDSSHEAVRPHELWEAVMPLVQLQARKLGVQVQLQCASSLPPVQVDRTMVEQVLLNLARNGMQAMEAVPLRERVLRLAVRHCSPAQNPSLMNWLEFSVSDQGSGIDEATAAQLFTPFVSTKAEGMGLGLSLCRTVVEQHGGVLRYDKQTPSGTIFLFTLPLASTASP
jgi:two-component system, LuxR family, sensor histidine kinase DctS